MPETLTLPAVAAQDGVDREASQDPSVHRVLVVVDPPMQGRDVANLQRAISARLKARGIADDVPVASHGKFTEATALAAIEAQYFLGPAPGHLPAHGRQGPPDPHRGRPARSSASPTRRTPDQLQRAKDRRGQLERGPRYYEELREVLRRRRRRQGRARVRGRAGRHQGAPAGLELRARRSTTGSTRRGYNGPVPWCGCFVNACIMAARPALRRGLDRLHARHRRAREGGHRRLVVAQRRPARRPGAVRHARRRPRRSTSRSSASASRTRATRPTAATPAPVTAARATAAWSRAATTARRSGRSRSSASRARRTSSSPETRARL